MFEVNVKSRAGRQQKKIKMSEDFLLKWNDHHTLFFAGAEKLYQDEEFTDVTLAAGSKLFKAHKLVLSICSPYFQSLFRRLGPEKHVIFLKDISSLHLELLLQYMYNGEIKVQEDELVTILSVAQSLEIKGLTDNSESNKQSDPIKQSSNYSPSPQPVKRKASPTPTQSSAPPSSSSSQAVAASPSNVPKRPRPSEPYIKQETAPVIDIMEQEPEIGIPNEYVDIDVDDHNNYGDGSEGIVATEEGYEEYHQGYDTGDYFHDGAQGDKVLQTGEFSCRLCGKCFIRKGDLNKHYAVHSEDRPHICRYPGCGVSFKTSSNRTRHEKSHHDQ